MSTLTVKEKGEGNYDKIKKCSGGATYSLGFEVAQKSYVIASEVSQSQSRGGVSIQSRHPELVSGSSHCDDESSPLTPTLSCTSLRIQAHKTRSSSVRFASRRARGKRVAFTLAEVLITLAIIGVVAAMTIPTLMQNYKKKLIETRLLSGYSKLSQAINLSTADNGDISTWRTSEDLPEVTYEHIKEWYDFYLAPYFKVLKVEKEAETENLVAYLLDGSAVLLTYYLSDLWIYPEAKDLDNPKDGVTRFKFWLGLKRHTVDAWQPDMKYCPKTGIEPYSYAWDGTYEGAKYSTLDTRYGCYQEYGALCTKLIQLNGWKIPDDYPHKF